MAAEGWSVSGYTSGYKIFWDVPYQRDEVEDAQEQSGFVKTRIAVGDTSGVIASVMRRTNGLGGLDVNISFAMLSVPGVDAVRDLFNADNLTDAEALSLIEGMKGNDPSMYPFTWSVCAKETAGGVFNVIAALPATSAYCMVAGYRLDDIHKETRPQADTVLVENMDGVSTDYDVVARGTGDGMYVRRKGPGGDPSYVKYTGISSGNSLVSETAQSFPDGGSMQWFPINAANVAAIDAIAGVTGSLPSGSLLALPPDVEYSFVSGEASHDRERFCLQLSTRNPLPWRFPSRNIYKAACLWAFKSPECGYSGVAATCDKTIATCRSLQNIERIGCFPGCGTGGLAQ
jgi:hypothetical protein